MGDTIIAGNWKSNKGIAEADVWLRQFNVKCQMSRRRQSGYGASATNVKWEEVNVILCAPFTLLYYLKQEIDRFDLPLELGAQDVSPYPDGAYTGGVNARQVKELADWVIIGHSERRKYFGETDAILVQKVQLAKAAGLSVIYCVPDENTVVPPGVDIVAYEPVWAIGTGKSDTPDNAGQVIESIKSKTHIQRVIYGGSVTPDNVRAFVEQPMINGVLPGGASMDPQKFANLIHNACNQS